MTDEPVAVRSECCPSAGYWYLVLRPHNAGAVSTTLAAGSCQEICRCT